MRNAFWIPMTRCEWAPCTLFCVTACFKQIGLRPCSHMRDSTPFLHFKGVYISCGSSIEFVGSTIIVSATALHTFRINWIVYLCGYGNKTTYAIKFISYWVSLPMDIHKLNLNCITPRFPYKVNAWLGFHILCLSI